MRGLALKISLTYAAGAAAYKVLSDRFLAEIVDHDTFVALQSYKGFAFVVVTAGLLHLLLQRLEPRRAPANAGGEGRTRAPTLAISGAVALTLSVLCVGWLVFQSMVASMEQKALDEVRAIAQMKAGDLGRWLQAQQANAVSLAAGVASQGALEGVELRGLGMAAIERDLNRRGAEFHFAAVDLIDAEGRSFFGDDDRPPEVVAAVARAFAKSAPAFVDLHVKPGAEGPRFGFVAPLPRTEGARRFALYAELAARDFLYPFVASWPLPRATGAGSIARRDGEDVLFLSGSPRQPDDALRLRLRYADPAAPIARFLRGEALSGRGRDARGIPIFAAGTMVPGTDWIFGARLDESEALADRNYYARTVGLGVTLAIVGVWVIAGFVLQGQKLARARAERRMQRRFQETFEQAAVGMIHTDLDGRVLRINRRAIDMFGYGRTEVLAMDILTFAEPDHLAGMRASLESLRNGARRHYYVERRYRRKDGSCFDVGVYASLARGEDGEPDYIMLVVEDITCRKATQTALEQSEERFRLALESAREGVWDWRPETDEAYFSPGWKAMLGYGDEEIENRASAWRRVVAEEGRERFRRQFHEIRAGLRKSFEFETRMRCRDGRWIDILSRGLPVFNAEGRMERVVGADTDITERKAHEAEQRLAATVFVSTHEGVCVTDAARNIIMVNPAFQEITGYSEAEVRGENPRKLKSDLHDADFYRAIWRAIDEKGVWRGEIWNRRKDGIIYPEWLTISAVRDGAGAVTNYVGLFTDITRIKESEERLKFLAHHDPLTALPNRTLLSLRIAEAIARAERRAGREAPQGAVLFLDLDRFKTVNDSLGHQAGDELLTLVAERWKRALRPSDTLARVGGDEFVVLLEEIRDAYEAAAIGHRLIAATAEPFALSRAREACVGLSVGVSLFPVEDGLGLTEAADGLIQRADSALYLAKQKGGATLQFYSEAVTEEANARLALEAGLRRGLERGEFALQYQPLVALKDGATVGVEALVRWRSPSGLVPPDQFIPLAEKTGMIVPLGEWVLREACARMKAWRDAGAPIETIAVNLSPVQLARTNVAERVAAVLAETGLPPRCLEIEITENAFAEPGGEVEAKLRALKTLGVRLAMDDFGAGHSSLFYLKRFPIDKLKLDRGFIKDIPRDPVSMEIAMAIVRLANSLKVTALAEGVETREQADFLAASGCALAQGYLFDRPLWEEELLARLGSATGLGRKAG
jgi:diguanylate cyclase (GGDEF)-like protein/PAS domain S-box-containing protein